MHPIYIVVPTFGTYGVHNIDLYRHKGFKQTFRSLALFSHVTGTMKLTSAPPSDKISDIEALEAFGDTTKNN